MIPEALFLGQSSPGFTGMAEVGQNYLEEGLNVGREGRVSCPGVSQGGLWGTSSHWVFFFCCGCAAPL